MVIGHTMLYKGFLRPEVILESFMMVLSVMKLSKVKLLGEVKIVCYFHCTNFGQVTNNIFTNFGQFMNLFTWEDMSASFL